MVAAAERRLHHQVAQLQRELDLQVVGVALQTPNIITVQVAAQAGIVLQVVVQEVAPPAQAVLHQLAVAAVAALALEVIITPVEPEAVA